MQGRITSAFRDSPRGKITAIQGQVTNCGGSVNSKQGNGYPQSGRCYVGQQRSSSSVQGYKEAVFERRRGARTLFGGA